ncbi:MAG TPA: CopG family ribbon-helix-helix protein [Candidatus Lokiarchaeia archaeon]|nr:CopG family ribbon-helix-helix protein [Candidatus Lokiarchaeia archaeon]
MPPEDDGGDYKRFSISLPGKLLDDFDTYVLDKHKLSRSDAIRKAMRKFIAEDRWEDLEGTRVGSITIILSHGGLTAEHHSHGDADHEPYEHEHGPGIASDHEHAETHEDLLRSNEIEHMYKDIIVSTLHVHLEDDRCLEIIAVKGLARRIKELYDNLVGLKGVEMHDFSIIS